MIAVKENQAPNRSNYSKKEVSAEVAMAAFAVYTLHADKLEKSQSVHPETNVWKKIGYWRSQKTLTLRFEEKDTVVQILNQKENEYEFRIGEESIKATLIYIDKGEADVCLNGENYFAKIALAEKAMMTVSVNGKNYVMKRNDLLEGVGAVAGSTGASAKDSNVVKSPMPGKIFKLHVKEGDKVMKGDVLLVVESMKMENRIVSAKDAVIKKVNVSLNDMIEASTELIVLDESK